jgi:NAD(P)-dependent dehydrogenase (short-subunit alcohol dehydrogenase family)
MLGEEMRFKPIDEQVVALMGASSGIGRETAIRFAKRGAKVVVSARNEGALRSLVDQIRRAGGEALAVPADVAEFEQVKAVADRAAAEYGTLDTWVHLSGVGLYAAFDRTEPEEFKRVMDVNLMGQVYGAMVALPHLKREGRGALIHISSVEAKRSAPFHSAYAASKHAIDGFLESLRVELKREGWSIGVTNVMPAAINTPFFSSSRSKIGVKPMGFPPIYQPNTVADVVLYAAEHPTREVVAGGAGKAMLLTQRISPRLMDALMLLAGFDSQKTDEPKSEDDPHNLFETVYEDRIEGDFSDRAHPRSFHNWLETYPLIRRAVLAGLALGIARLLRARSS